MNKPAIHLNRPDGNTVTCILEGEWKIGMPFPPIPELRSLAGDSSGVRAIRFEGGNITGWDSGLLTYLLRIFSLAKEMDITVDADGLPQGVRRLITLATAVPERQGARKGSVKQPFFFRMGDSSVALWQGVRNVFEFVGDAFISLFMLMIGRARFRGSDFVYLVQECGARALPIVSLISLLVGLILAYVGSIQLRMFGAQIYVANLVGIAMVREMGAIMTGIIIAGRTGASFAAQLGTMQVNEEIDALQTLGISPMEFLVLPRMLALFFMMPLLTLYADLMGILGGMIVGVLILDINPVLYYNQTRDAVGINNLWIGLFMGAVFGLLIAVTGCLRGIQCGRSAQAVGQATTSAVVSGIVSIIVATAIITVVCDILGI